MDEGDYESILSAQAFPWAIKLYSSTSDVPEAALRAGDIIQMNNNELNGCLAAFSMVPIVPGKTPAELVKLGITRKEEMKRQLDAAKLAEHVDTVFLNRGLDDDGGLKQESTSFWQVYLYQNIQSGAPLVYESQSVVLRHMVTGKYLAVSEPSAGSKQSEPTLVSKPSPECVIQIMPVSGDADTVDHIATASFCRLYHTKTKTYIHADGREELNALDEHTLAQCIAKKDLDDDLLEEKVSISFRSKTTFEDG